MTYPTSPCRIASCNPQPLRNFSSTSLSVGVLVVTLAVLVVASVVMEGLLVVCFSSESFASFVPNVDVDDDDEDEEDEDEEDEDEEDDDEEERLIPRRRAIN